MGLASAVATPSCAAGWPNLVGQSGNRDRRWVVLTRMVGTRIRERTRLRYREGHAAVTRDVEIERAVLRGDRVVEAVVIGDGDGLTGLPGDVCRVVDEVLDGNRRAGRRSLGSVLAPAPGWTAKLLWAKDNPSATTTAMMSFVLTTSLVCFQTDGWRRRPAW